MAIAFPNIIDALVEGFPPAFKATGVPQRKHIDDDSQNVGEYFEKLFGRLSALVFHIDRQINNVLVQGGRLPKKLTQWAMEARAMKVRVSDLLKEPKKLEDLVEIGIKMITHLKQCPFKDDIMYDKPIPVVIRNQKSSLVIPGGGLQEEYEVEEEYEYEGDDVESRRNEPISEILPEDDEATVSVRGIELDREGEIRIVDESMILHDAAEYSVEQRDISFQEKGVYSVVSEDNRLWLKSDNQILLIGDYPSPVNPMLNLLGKDLHELPEKPEYPNSLILFLQGNKRLALIHRSFFDSMPALSFLDMSDTKIRILPSSLFELSKLKVLLLRNCICLEKIPPEIGKLRLMKVLDLSGTELYELPDEAGQLSLMRSLHLSFYGPDDESEYEDLASRLFSPGLFSRLRKVEALSVSVHPEDHRWNETVALMINDISKMEMLSYLKFYFPEVETFKRFIETSSSWKKGSFKKFDFTVGQNVKRIASRVPNEVDLLFSREERCLRYVNGDEASPLVKSVLIRSTSLYLDHHTEAQSLSEFDVSNLQGLRFCVVRECPKMEVILDERNVGSGSGGAFPRLEHLRIYFLWELEHVTKPAPQAGRVKRMFKTPTPPRSFEALRCLIIVTCPKLRFILRESMLRCLANLEELVVEDCERVGRIIEGEKKKARRENDVLPGLRKLELRYLPELVSVGCGVCFSQGKVSVYGCPKLILDS